MISNSLLWLCLSITILQFIFNIKCNLCMNYNLRTGNFTNNYYEIVFQEVHHLYNRHIGPQNDIDCNEWKPIDIIETSWNKKNLLFKIRFERRHSINLRILEILNKNKSKAKIKIIKTTNIQTNSQKTDKIDINDDIIDIDTFQIDIPNFAEDTEEFVIDTASHSCDVTINDSNDITNFCFPFIFI